MHHPLSQEAFLAQVASRNPHQPEFIQAVSEVIASIWPYVEHHPRYLQYCWSAWWSPSASCSSG